MTEKRVTKFICDHCGKKGYSKGHMRKHESRCTMNPGRTCHSCINLLQKPHNNLQILVRMLPDPRDWTYRQLDTQDYQCFEHEAEDTEKLMPQIRGLTGDCPACIMAALRQVGIPVPAITSFDMKKEYGKIWSDINDWNHRNYNYGY